MPPGHKGGIVCCTLGVWRKWASCIAVETAFSNQAGASSSPAINALALVLTITLATTGCTTGPGEWIRNGFKVGPNYARPPAPVADDWIDSDSPELNQEEADYSNWWAVFHDPVLNDLVNTAHEQNLPLKIAGMRVLEARAQLDVAKGTLFPQQQQMAGDYVRTEFSNNSFPFGSFPLPKMIFDTWSLGFDAAWELDFWGKFRRMIESADANLNAKVENYDDALVILQAEVAAMYTETRTLEERLRLAHKNVTLQKNTVRITQDRFENGMVSNLDVQQARSNLAATESMIPVLETMHRRTQNRLCTLLGMPPRDLASRLGRGEIPGAPPEVAVGIPAELLRRRPDVRRAEREAAAQCARIGIAESELYPQIAITGTIAVEAEYFSNLFDWDSITGAVGPGFRWNILNYGRLRSNIRVQDARFGQLVLKYQETVLRANEEAENAITAYLREQARVEFLQESTEATAQAVELADAQYDQGLIDFQRVLDSQRVLVQQQDMLAQSRGNVALNLIALYKALGGGWQVRFGQIRTPEATLAESPPEEELTPEDKAPLPPEPLPVPEAPESLEAPKVPEAPEVPASNKGPAETP